MKDLNAKLLFWASFLTLIAAGMGMSIRNDIMADWGHQFGFTQTELGKITGMGLFGFGLTIIFFSFFADAVGYGKLMIIAFLLHASAVLTTLAAPYVYQTSSGKEGAYWCLYLGQLLFSLGNGTCEAVINPLTASLFPRNKTHWLNILHAGWPGGLVLGALISLGLTQFETVGWMVKWGIVMAPVLIYGILMVGRPFPQSEAKLASVSVSSMMGEIGMLGAAVAVGLLGLYMSTDLAPKLGIPDWSGWIAAAVLWVGFGFIAGFRVGYVILACLFLLHAMVGFVELGTDTWIVDITKTVLSNRSISLMAFIWTNVLMFTLRFFAGPIVHKISPIGLLFFSAILGTVGLLLLGQPWVNTTWLWIAAVSVYGIGKTFYWPTMLGVISERYPKGGALALGFSGGVGMLSAGILGGPMIGYMQDYAATQKIQETTEGASAYKLYKVDKAVTAPVPGLPPTAGLNNAKIGVLSDDGKQLREDLDISKKSGQVDKNLEQLDQWWEKEGSQNAAKDRDAVRQATLYGDRQALTWTSAVPATMAVGYLLLLLYFSLTGGYKQVHLIEEPKLPGAGGKAPPVNGGYTDGIPGEGVQATPQ